MTLSPFRASVKTSEITNKTAKIKNSICAISALAAAMPPNPNKAATIETTKNIIDQYNISFSPCY